MVLRDEVRSVEPIAQPTDEVIQIRRWSGEVRAHHHGHLAVVAWDDMVFVLEVA